MYIYNFIKKNKSKKIVARTTTQIKKNVKHSFFLILICHSLWLLKIDRYLVHTYCDMIIWVFLVRQLIFWQVSCQIIWQLDNLFCFMSFQMFFLINQLCWHFLYCFGFNLRKKSSRKSKYLQSTVEQILPLTCVFNR